MKTNTFGNKKKENFFLRGIPEIKIYPRKKRDQCLPCLYKKNLCKFELFSCLKSKCACFKCNFTLNLIVYFNKYMCECV